MSMIVKSFIIISIPHLFRNVFLGPIRFGDKENTSEIEKKVNMIAKKMGVKKHIKVAVNDGCPWQCHGFNFLNGPAGITIPSFSRITEEDVKTAILSHEIAHIKNNDVLKLWIDPTIVAIASTVLFASVIDFAAAETLGIVVGTIYFIALSQFQEQRADMEACKYLNNKEKQALLHFFKALQKGRLEYRNAKGLPTMVSLWRKFRFDSEGNARLSYLTHPSFKTRIKKIEKVMN